jgi:outer membrane protein assembly factor BamB
MNPTDKDTATKSAESSESISPAPGPSGLQMRLATFLLPPLGLLLLLIGRPRPSKLLGGLLFIGLYTIVYIIAVGALLVKTNCLFVEFGGSGLPHLTRKLVKTDFDSLEKHRQEQMAKPHSTNRTGGSYWTGFRGPRNDGHYTEQPLNLAWDKHPPELLWKQPTGGGYSSFAVANGIAYTIEQRREEEALVAYDVATGTELWSNTWRAKFVESEGMGGIGPRSTPTWHAGKVYALGALGEFRCVDAISGDTIWRRHALNDSMSTQLQFGAIASPIIVGERVVALTGMPAGRNGCGTISYSLDHGEPLVWSSVDEKAAYATPVSTTLMGENQILIFTGFNLLALNPATREVRWSHKWNISYDNSIAQPLIVSSNRVFLSGGYGKGCELLRLIPAKGTFITRSEWKNTFMKNKFSSSVYHDGYIYGLDNNILVCLSAETGRKQWKDGRYGYGQILLAHGHIIIMCGDGDLALVKADPERHHEIARIDGIAGKTWNYPAIADGRLLIRNHAEMACFDLRIN